MDSYRCCLLILTTVTTVWARTTTISSGNCAYSLSELCINMANDECVIERSCQQLNGTDCEQPTVCRRRSICRPGDCDGDDEHVRQRRGLSTKTPWFGWLTNGVVLALLIGLVVALVILCVCWKSKLPATTSAPEEQTPLPNKEPRVVVRLQPSAEFAKTTSVSLTESDFDNATDCVPKAHVMSVGCDDSETSRRFGSSRQSISLRGSVRNFY